MRSPVGVGILGSGQISRRYLATLMAAPEVEVVSCADVALDRAAVRAEQFNVPRAYGPDELLADPDVQLVVNLTWARAHQEMSLAAIGAGKSVYSEKPLAATFEQAAALCARARHAGARLGSAPATFLGASLQTARSLIDDGAIGVPQAAIGLFLDPGPDQFVWDPEPYYGVGGGPLFDAGPYYLTALVALLGPARRVSGSAPRRVSERRLAVGRAAGATIPVAVPTHASATIDFASGAVGTVVTSWEVVASNEPGHIEVYGSEGTLQIADPAALGEPVRVRRSGDEHWREAPLGDLPSDWDAWMGIGVVEMASAMLDDRPHRAAAELGLHVTEIMQAVYDSSRSGRSVELTTSVERPEPLPGSWWSAIARTAEEARPR
jgi:predicted dehydrogenase